MLAVQNIVSNINKISLTHRHLRTLTTIDISNLFNSIPWNHILQALDRKDGMSEQLRNIVREYLSGRTVFTGANEDDLQTLGLTCGVPQGSVLDPHL